MPERGEIGDQDGVRTQSADDQDRHPDVAAWITRVLDDPVAQARLASASRGFLEQVLFFRKYEGEDCSLYHTTLKMFAESVRLSGLTEETAFG